MTIPRDIRFPSILSRWLLAGALGTLPLMFSSAARGEEEKGVWIAVVAPALEAEVRPLADARRREGWAVTVMPASADSAGDMGRIAGLAVAGLPTCVVLFGEVGELVAGGTAVPAGKGRHLRMKDRPTDLPWAGDRGKGGAEVGRLPARSVEEARTMVRKILSWPERAASGPPSPLARMVGGEHGAPASVSKVADNLTNTMTARLVRRLPAEWRLEAAVHVGGSAWPVATADLAGLGSRWMSTRSTLLAYMGHSGPWGAESGGVPMFTGTQWRDLPAAADGPGLFFTCGCHSCSLSAPQEAYSLAAIRSAGGPPAVIGAEGESWAAMGYLAMSGLTARLAEAPAPVRTGEFWTASQAGLESGGINPVEFALLDRADGTRGQVPLDRQRLEHLEMWMLLGDPAMQLLPARPRLSFQTAAAPVAGGSLVVTGRLPEELAGAAVTVTLERHPGNVPGSLPAVPDSGVGRDDAIRERNRLASDTRLATSTTPATGVDFSATLGLPATLPPKPWTLRVTAGKAEGVMTFP